jgi:hypothetical protein
MEHFATEDWADFARGVVQADRKSLMDSHLQTGCRKCTKLFQLWRRVHSAAQRQGDSALPEGLVRMAKAAYGEYGVVGKRAKVRLADVLFDSFRGPLAVGVRSTTSSARQVLYATGTHRIDVRLEPHSDSDKVAVIGQVLDSAEPGRDLQGLTVRLLAGRKVLGESETQRFGEFQFECELTEHLELRVKLANEGEIRAALVQPDLAAVRQAAHPTDSKRVKKVLRSHQRTRKKG